MDTATLKPRYEAQIREYLDDVLQTFRGNGIEAELGSDGECWDGDTRWSLSIEPESDEAAELTIQIIASDNGWDAPERDGLNVMADMVDFTDDVWVNPEDLPELDRRLEDVLSAPPQEWLARYIES